MGTLPAERFKKIVIKNKVVYQVVFKLLASKCQKKISLVKLYAFMATNFDVTATSICGKHFKVAHRIVRQLWYATIES